VATVNGTVTNTGTATGTFDDASGTQASAHASATVTGQDCGRSQIAPTATTCSDFKNHTAATLSELDYTVKGGTINSVAPGVFFYWVQLDASAGSNTFTIHQTITTGNFDSHFFSFANGSNVFDANCVAIAGASITQSGADVTVTFNAASSGTVFIGIKYDSTSVKGFSAPSPPTVHYTFATVGLEATTTSGLDLIRK
jgi:hypothetical protein